MIATPGGRHRAGATMKTSSLFLFVFSTTAATLAACGGTADLGGTPADGGPGALSPEAGTPGPKPGTPDAAPTSPTPQGALDPTLALRAAVFIGSCIPDDRTNRYLNRMYTTRDDEPDALLIRASGACFATKTNGCAAVLDCLGVSASVVATCSGSCDGNTAVSCDDSLEFRSDCTKLGQTCIQQGNRGRCVGPGTQAACDFETYASKCENGRPTYCGSSGVELGPTCADHGLACVALTDSFGTRHMCGGTGPACTNKGGTGPGSAVYEGIACNGTSLRACVNSSETTLDCGTVATGFGCQSGASGTFCGLANECAPGGATKPTCEGTSLVVCNAGKTTKVDCTALGFTGCNATAGACTPSPWGP